MNFKLLIILCIVSLIILASCKKTETKIVSTEQINLSKEQEKPKEEKKQEPKREIKQEDLPWNDCAKSFKKDELLEICGLKLASAKYYDVSKSCQINLASEKNEKTFIEIESYDSNSEAKDKYEFVLASEGKKNNATITGTIAQWQEVIRGTTSEGEQGKGLARDKVEMYKGKKEVEISVVPANSCKDLKKLVKTVFTLV